jgi:hypothetical protein
LGYFIKGTSRGHVLCFELLKSYKAGLTVLYKPMLSFSSKLFIPVVYLFITISSLVQSHELTFNRRGHGFLKKRLLSDLPIVNLPSTSSDSQIATSIISQSTTSDTSPTIQTSSLASTSPVSTSTGAASTITSSQSTSSIASSSASSPTATNASSSSTSPTSQTSTNINLTPITLIPTASVVASTITSTQSISSTASSTATPQAQSASSKTKSTTVTVLIAVAASVGGIAILWTIFRKWKLSSSKEFDRRLNPITDWQPTNGEDDLVSTLRRAPSSSSSFHSGGGSGDGHIPSRSAGLAPLDHDFTAGTAPIGGYADLARASNTNPPMQQTFFNHGYDVGVPLHHQTGYGAHDAYDYNGGSARY